MRWGLVGLPIQVMSGIENALWDLKGKALGVPVYELLGGLAQEKLRLYASAYASVWPVEKTAVLANACGYLKSLRIGARNMPAFGEVESFLRSKGWEGLS